MDGEKKCLGCKTVKPFSEFDVRKDRPGGFLRSRCRTCQAEKMKATYHANHPKSLARQRSRKWNKRNRAVILFNAAKSRAVKKGLLFTIDSGDIKRRVEIGVCEITGEPFDFSGEPGRKSHSPSLDQIIPGGGYTVANTRVVLWAINSMCGDWGLEAARRIASKIPTPYEG